MSSISDVHEDVLMEILKRVDVRSLVKLRCVSKAWFYLISSPAFVSIQTLFTISRTDIANLLLIGYKLDDNGPQDNFSLLFDDRRSLAECRDLGTPLLGSRLQVNGHCHGLLCLSTIIYSNYRWKKPETVIWNPTLGISLALPQPSLNSSFEEFLGFGFDAKRNDYKVIRIPFEQDDDSRYELFELSQNAWRIVTPRVRPPPIYCLARRLSLNGLAHWLGARSTIVSYNFSDEVFREMKLPAALNGVALSSLLIRVKDMRYLSVIHCDRRCRTFKIWVMKEYGVEKSWSKLFNVPHPDLSCRVTMLGFRTNGELLAMMMQAGKLVSFYSGTNAVTLLGCNDYAKDIYFVGDHVETLGLLQVPGAERRQYKKRECTRPAIRN